MTQTPEIQELSIVLNIPNHNSTLLTPDFLAGSGIIPSDWELSRPPVLSARASQVAFKNGISLVAQPGTVTISESLNHKQLDELQIATIARKYATTLPNLDYQGIGINPKRFMPFDNNPEGARQYITQTLLAPGDWQQLGEAPMQATLNLVYPLGDKQLNLTIAEARLKGPEADAVPVVLFVGNFNYALEGDTPEARLHNLNQALAHWQTDLETFQNLIEQKFQPQVLDNRLSALPNAV